MHYLRNLGRRKLRTTLTVLGITIGIWALVVFGSMANKITALVQGGSPYYADKVIVSDSSGGTGGFSAAPMSLAVADQLTAVPGIDVVVPTVMMLMDEQPSGVSMGVPPMIGGQVPGATRDARPSRSTYANGRGLAAADEGQSVTVLGSDIAQKYEKQVGDTIELRGVPFTVVGILEPTLTAPDQEAMVPMRAAQQLLVASLPPIVQQGVSANHVATSMVVYPKDAGATRDRWRRRFAAPCPTWRR